MVNYFENGKSGNSELTLATPKMPNSLAEMLKLQFYESRLVFISQYLPYCSKFYQT